MTSFEVLSVVLGGILLLVCVVQSIRAFWTARLLGSAGPTPMAELAEGLLEVRGTSLAEGGLTAPLSGRPCMYWRVLVEQQRRTRWETIVDRREGVPFWADDGTGRVRIDPGTAEVVVSGASRVRTGVYAHPSTEWAEVSARLGELETQPTQPYLRWREEYLDAGDVVTVVGTARREPEGGWELTKGEDAFVVSDRDDAEVIRHHRRLGRRWALAALATLVGVGALVWQLLSV